MKIIKILPSFERSLKKLSPKDKGKVKKTLEKFNNFILTGTIPKGLGFKKIGIDKYELRVDIRLRIITKIEKDIIYLILVSTHDNIKRYLRDFR